MPGQPAFIGTPSLSHMNDLAASTRSFDINLPEPTSPTYLDHKFLGQRSRRVGRHPCRRHERKEQHMSIDELLLDRPWRKDWISQKKVCLYSSPHLRSVQERIQINLQPISESLFAKYNMSFPSTSLSPNLDACGNPHIHQRTHRRRDL